MLDANANEAALRETQAPAILHIATHGLFLEEQSTEGGRSTLVQADGFQLMDLTSQLLGQSTENSTFRVALALAGASNSDRAPDASQDGLLTVTEASSLNLFGTQLVVLSACDTGRGSVKVGQGVWGLDRAFFMAGAEAIIMSLWPVSDTETASLMVRYYSLLLDQSQRRGRISSLWDAMKAIKTLQPHPYYWAPFIAMGHDASVAVPGPRAGFSSMAGDPS